MAHDMGPVRGEMRAELTAAPAALAEACADGHVHASPAWFAHLASLPVPPGTWRFSVAWSGDDLAGVLPWRRWPAGPAPSPFDDLAAAPPGPRRTRLATLRTRLRTHAWACRAWRWSGVSAGDVWSAGAPDVWCVPALAPSAQRRAAQAALLAAACRAAAAEGAALWLRSVRCDGAGWLEACRRAGFQVVHAGWRGVADPDAKPLPRLPGWRWRCLPLSRCHAATLAELACRTPGRRPGPTPNDQWFRSLGCAFGPAARVALLEADGTPVGYALALVSKRRGEAVVQHAAWHAGYRWPCTPAALFRRRVPQRLAARLGLRQVWLDPEASVTALRHVEFADAWWFPRRRQRLLLGPPLRALACARRAAGTRATPSTAPACGVNAREKA